MKSENKRTNEHWCASANATDCARAFLYAQVSVPEKANQKKKKKKKKIVAGFNLQILFAASKAVKTFSFLFFPVTVPSFP